MIYFSFCLYGTNPKYTHGMIANAELIQQYYPEARTIVYIAGDVPSYIRDRLLTYPSVIFKEITDASGCSPFFDRFKAIDEPDCDIMFVRDADSRIHARDRACIADFLDRPDKTLHIIRDHAAHWYQIMGGMWAIRKAHMRGLTMSQLILEWSTSNNMTEYMDDEEFLKLNIYRPTDALIHDRYRQHEPLYMHSPFRVPIINNLFVGQVHLFREDGTEYTEFSA